MNIRAMLLVHHDLGGTGPPLLILHANSLCGKAYKPMVSLLSLIRPLLCTGEISMTNLSKMRTPPGHAVGDD